MKRHYNSNLDCLPDLPEKSDQNDPDMQQTIPHCSRKNLVTILHPVSKLYDLQVENVLQQMEGHTGCKLHKRRKEMMVVDPHDSSNYASYYMISISGYQFSVDYAKELIDDLCFDTMFNKFNLHRLRTNKLYDIGNEVEMYGEELFYMFPNQFRKHPLFELCIDVLDEYGLYYLGTEEKPAYFRTTPKILEMAKDICDQWVEESLTPTSHDPTTLSFPEHQIPPSEESLKLLATITRTRFLSMKLADDGHHHITFFGRRVDIRAAFDHINLFLARQNKEVDPYCTLPDLKPRCSYQFRDKLPSCLRTDKVLVKALHPVPEKCKVYIESLIDRIEQVSSCCLEFSELKRNKSTASYYLITIRGNNTQGVNFAKEVIDDFVFNRLYRDNGMARIKTRKRIVVRNYGNSHTRENFFYIFSDEFRKHPKLQEWLEALKMYGLVDAGTIVTPALFQGCLQKLEEAKELCDKWAEDYLSPPHWKTVPGPMKHCEKVSQNCKFIVSRIEELAETVTISPATSDSGNSITFSGRKKYVATLADHVKFDFSCEENPWVG